MADVSQTTFSNAFSWIKIYYFWLKFDWSLFLRVQLTIFQHWFRKWLGADLATSLYLNQWWLLYWRIYASLGLNELIFLVIESYDCINELMLYISVISLFTKHWINQNLIKNNHTAIDLPCCMVGNCGTRYQVTQKATLLYKDFVTKSVNGAWPYPRMTLISFRRIILDVLWHVLCFLSDMVFFLFI